MIGYLIDARDKPGLLVAFMKEFEGNARITFEGNLSKCDFSAFPATPCEPDGVFQRNTPSLDMITSFSRCQRRPSSPFWHRYCRRDVAFTT